MKHLPYPPVLSAIAGAIILFSAMAHAELKPETFQQTAQAQNTDPAQRALVQQAQLLLIRQGFDPGPTDGLIGERTTRSVQAFQRREGLIVDGLVTEALHAALRQADARRDGQANTAASPSARPKIQAEVAPSPVSIAGSTWTLTDSRNAKLTLKLLSGGAVGAVGNPAHWTWQYENGEILISYDNKMGGWVKRRGRVAGLNELHGDATSSRGRNWAWRATRNGGVR